MCSGCTYDASGNVTDDSFKSYAWDPYNKLLSVSSTACGTNGECATYDAFGRMVESSKDSTYTENWYTQAGTVLMSGTTLAHAYLRSPGGGTFLEYGSATDYLHKDWLGNARIASLISGQTVGADMAYAPYGEVYNFIAGAAGDWMFTGDTTQLVSEYLFDTPNREFASSNQGRWLSPDPAGAGWNQYAYSTNPNSAIDPSGLASTTNVSIWLPALDLGGGLDWAAFGLWGGFGGAGQGDADGSSSNSPSSPQLCQCPADLTSGALAGTAAVLPDSLVPSSPFYSSGDPAGVQIVGFLFEYQGPNAAFPDPITGNPTPLIGTVPIGTMVDVNVWQEQLVDTAGIPVMPGNYDVTEQLSMVANMSSGNIVTEAGGFGTTNGTFVDNIGVTANAAIGYSKNDQMFSVNGVGLSTMISQYLMYGGQAGGLMAFPQVVVP
jgi:RHS repeat-associated protein